MISADQLHTALHRTGADVHIADQYYSLPDRQYIQRLGRRLYGHLPSAYVEESFDCDDFALFAAAMARIDHACHNKPARTHEGLIIDPPQHTGLAVGFAAVLLESSAHMLTLAVHSENGVIVPVLYEPQPINGLCLNEFSSPVVQWLYLYI